MLVSLISLISAVLPFAVGATHGRVQRGHHQELAQRARGDVNKRAFDNSRFTFYDVGLGACGQYNSPGDFIVALNVAQFGEGYPGPHCFKSITISYGGKTAQATIMDECMGCPYGGLDFSTGLFSYFASQADGVLYGSWWFNDDASGPTPSTGSGWTPAPSPDWSTPTPTPILDWSTPAPTPAHHHHHHDAANTPSTTTTPETGTTTETPTTTETGTTTETPTTTETGTTTETATSTPTTTETSGTATATYSSLSTYGTDTPLPSNVIIVPVPVPAANAAHPENLEVLSEAIVNLSMLVSGQRGN